MYVMVIEANLGAIVLDIDKASNDCYSMISRCCPHTLRDAVPSSWMYFSRWKVLICCLHSCTNIPPTRIRWRQLLELFYRERSLSMLG